MATAAQTVPTYCTLITRSRLMTPQQVKTAYELWQQSIGGVEGDIESLRRFLVSKKHLTDYQSHLLMRGHTEGYFLDDYKILEMISKGRMAGVYKAIHESGQMVAIKVLPPSKAKDPTLLSRFRREGKLLTRMVHPNVVRAFQLGESQGRQYIVLEYFDSDTLEEVLALRQRLSPPEAVRIMHQALLGLQHVFEKGMVHRDLKPSNLALTPPPSQSPGGTTMQSNVKILDLGLGRTTFDESTGESDPDSQLTTEGALLGSAEYIAPEQARSAHDADIRADIYSAGCILFHALTGQVPFPEKNVLTQIVKHATEPAPPLDQFLPQVPAGLQDALNWMMAKDPNQRYQTPAQAAQALHALIAHLPAPAVGTGPKQAYLQHLAAKGHVDATRPMPAVPPAPATIPVGRIETEAKKLPKRKEGGTAERPRVAADTASAAALLPGISTPYTSIDEYDVEVVAPPASAPPTPVEERSYFDLDRRDWIMVSAGGLLVAAALIGGYSIVQLIKKKPAPTVQEEPAPKEVIPMQPYRPRERKVEEPKVDDARTKEEPKTEVIKDEEPKKEEMKKDGPVLKKDEMTKDEMKKEPPKKDEMNKDEMKQAPAKSEPKKTDSDKKDTIQ